MLHRTIHDPIPPAAADIETPEMADAAVAVERGERHPRVLAELTDLAMMVARAPSDLAVTRIEAAKAQGGQLRAGEDPAAPLNKIAQTIRRTVALETKLADDVTSGRGALAAARAARAAKCKEAHSTAVVGAVRQGLEDAYYAACAAEAQSDGGDPPDGETVDELLDDAFEFLGDVDEFRDFLGRPVGETVSRLCAAIGLDPDSCRFDGQAWTVPRPPYECDTAREALWKRCLGRNAPPRAAGEERDAKPPG